MRPASSSKPIVFITYASADLAMATEFHDRLQAIVGDNVECFLAQKAIEFGKNWPSQVDRHLTEAACIIVILSDSALASSWVLFEAGVGYGRGVAVIPLAFAGFKIDRERPPLSFLHTLSITNVQQLNVALEHVATAVGRRFPKTFVVSDLTAIVAKAQRPLPKLVTAPLLTRKEIFDEAVRLVQNAHLNSVIRGVSSLVDTKDSPDRHMNRFQQALRAKFSEAIAAGGRMRYDVILGIHRNARNEIPHDAKAAIARRASGFLEIGAAGRLRMRECSDAWSMNLLLVNDHDAILAFPEGNRASRLRYGLRISGAELVAPIVHWYENGLKNGTKRIHRRDYA